MAVALTTAIIGAAGAGLQFAGAQSAKKADASARAAEEERREDLLAEIDRGRAAAADLREERDVPSELFAQLVRQYPALLGSILPSLTKSSISTTDTLADAGTEQFLRIQERLAPGTGQLRRDQLEQINQLNPENLAQEDILAITRKLAPLIPSGTLDPSTGSVEGATTNPVSLYRNIVSAKYDERRSDFLDRANQFVGTQNNAAVRQQVSAADFLEGNLNRAFDSAALLTAADVEQQQGDIDDQEAWIRLALQGLQPGYDPSGNQQAIAAGTAGAVNSLGSAADALSRIGK